MLSASSSSSISSEDRSGSSSDENSEILDDDGTAFVPYDEELEPVATEEEAAAYTLSVANEEEWELVLQRRFTGELEVGTWCTCWNCSVDIATKKEECICCKEIDRAGEVMENIERAGDCITLHPGFQDVCLNRWVLEVASLNLKTKAGKSYRAIFNQGRKTESEFLPSVSYRQFTRLLWEFTGSSKRHPLPCCAYKVIRTAFLSEDGQYHGFEDDES
ncbi:unnamed protein product [Porites lobata]|uniref:P2X purinoreceptor 7 intracellular domain-containing protein n=1 Tax=Porites lobata TaxID=104759 RepID=A0ABN8QCC6_9CNID|nr:unnamed protein product [Porites lobata]